jgi:nucleotide-binding universal stress UspA family protein
MAAKHILACVDFSEHSTRALAEVGEYARANGSKVTLIHISDTHPFVPPQTIIETASVTDEAAHREELAKLRDQHLTDVEVELQVVPDHAPAKAICEYAETLERWLIGSVAERVVRHAATNVYVVRQ